MFLDAPSAPSPPKVELNHRGSGLREVDGTISVEAPASVAYDVLRDYEGFERFIADSRCVVLSRSGPCDLLVRMSQLRSFLGLTLSLSLTLAVEEDHAARTVAMSLVRGLGVREYKAHFEVQETTPGCCVLRTVVASAPSVPAPRFLIDGIMRNSVASTLEQIRDECMTKDAARAPSVVAPFLSGRVQAAAP